MRLPCAVQVSSSMDGIVNCLHVGRYAQPGASVRKKEQARRQQGKVPMPQQQSAAAAGGAAVSLRAASDLAPAGANDAERHKDEAMQCARSAHVSGVFPASWD